MEIKRQRRLLLAGVRAFGELLKDKNETTKAAVQHLQFSDVKVIDSQMKMFARHAAGGTANNSDSSTRWRQHTVRAMQRAKQLFNSHNKLTKFLEAQIKSDNGLNIFADASTINTTANTLLQLKLFVQVKARNQL